MSISSLTTHAAQLLGYFDTQRAQINSALAAALAAAPTRAVINYYLDNIAGNDANDGLTEATPVATWAGLVARMGSLNDHYFRSYRINMAADAQPIEMTNSCAAESSIVHIVGTWNPRNLTAPLPRPTLQMMAYPGGGETTGFTASPSFTGFNVALRLSDLTVKTPAATTPALPWHTHNGLLRNGHNQRLIAENTTIIVDALPLNDCRLDLLYLWNTEIQRTQDGVGVPLINSPDRYASRWFLENITLPAGENLPDVLGITQWDANGYPVGIVSNADLSEVVE
jgi:hypothetical protein